jgi:hypothetical protein
LISCKDIEAKTAGKRIAKSKMINNIIDRDHSGEWKLCLDKPMFVEAKKKYEKKFGIDQDADNDIHVLSLVIHSNIFQANSNEHTSTNQDIGVVECVAIQQAGGYDAFKVIVLRQTLKHYLYWCHLQT